MIRNKNHITKQLFIIIVLGSCALAFYSAYQRRAAYRYDQTQSYHYRFSDSRAQVYDVKILHEALIFPKIHSEWDTGFLKVHAQSTLLGQLIESSVELSRHDVTFTQYFERGASGTRYINISPLHNFQLTRDSTIRLKRRHVSFDSRNAQLILFKNPEPKHTKILVVAPHPDDAEIAAYGLYSSNKDSYIVTVTAGDAGAKHYDEIYSNDTEHYVKKGELRVWDSIVVPMLGGIKPGHAINLGYFDATLEKMFKTKNAPVSSPYSHVSDINFYRSQNISALIPNVSGIATWDSLVGDFKHLIKKIRPTLIVTPYPAIDRHSDHKFSSIAVFEALRELDVHEGSLYLYTNHHTVSEFYPNGKSESIVSLPPYFSNALFFRSIYSHDLPIHKQHEKLFALEAMHDLRPDTEWRYYYGSLKYFFKKIKETMRGDFSYYRRAIRANEFFFIVNVEDIYREESFQRVIGKSSEL